MSATTVIWSGPVNLSQVNGATVPGARAIAVPCTGDGHPSCAQTGENLEDADGRRLPALLQQVGISEDECGDVILGAFSAGGSMAKRLLLHDADRERIRAVLLADATYTDWAASGLPLAPEGFVLFCLDALQARKLFVATASSAPNKTLPSGSQTLAAIRAEVERRSGLTFTPFTLPAGVDPAPVEAWKLKNVILADFKWRVAHGAHATKLAAPIWKTLLLPWLAETSGETPQKPPVPAPASLIADIHELAARKELYSRLRSYNHAAIRRLQEAFPYIGIDLVADGMFGPKTEAAVRALQAWSGIHVDGVAGPQTLAALADALESGARLYP